jgi:hypothetical protein
MSILLPLTLSAILTTDPLGYECVPEDQLEAAYALGGKGMRVPQTCIPEPCEQTFSEVTLAAYSGYQDDAHYRDYRSRMSDVCGAPTLWDDLGVTEEQLLWAVFDGGSGSIPLPAPTVSKDEASPESALPWAFSAGGSGGRGSTGGFGGFSGFSGFGGFGGTGGGKGSSFGMADPPPVMTTSLAELIPDIEPSDSGDGDRAPQVPTHAPIPAPIFLLSAAGLALLLFRRLLRGARA